MRPFGLAKASRRTLAWVADPSQPANTYVNCMSGAQAPRTFVAISFFLDRYLGLSTARTLAFIYVPSKAPKQFYENKNKYLASLGKNYRTVYYLI